MPEQLNEDPTVTIAGLIRDNWTKANTSYSSDPPVRTGWWDWGRNVPCVTVTNSNTVTVAGGDTGYSYMTGDGRVGQERNGFCLVNCWGGTFKTDALEAERDDGGFLSPKALAWQMSKEVRRILLDNAEGTTDGSGNVELLFISPGDSRRLADTDPDDEHPTLFRYEVEAKFGYVEES